MTGQRTNADRQGEGQGRTSTASGAAIATPRRTREIIRQYGFTFRKSLGQHFLTDTRVLDRIVEAAELDATQGAIEIGPGIGALTERLAQAAGKVVAVEIDGRLVPILEDMLASYRHVRIVHGDVLKTDLAALWQTDFAGMAGVSAVANLPYYATTPILMTLLERKLPLDRIVVMVQKEIAERMAAPPGGKDYGSLSVAVQYYCETSLVCHVPPGAFLPPPNVESAVVKLEVRREPAVRVEDEKLFFRVVQAAFAQRRKTLANNMVQLVGKERKEEAADLMRGLGIDPGRRGETLSLEEFAALTDALDRTGWIRHHA
jgi:16S rRNA (adenine1518-N6/adenine1519-N6)-dimethyltransferase